MEAAGVALVLVAVACGELAVARLLRVENKWAPRLALVFLDELRSRVLFVAEPLLLAHSPPAALKVRYYPKMQARMSNTFIIFTSRMR